jgi:hypothetical protein
VYTVQQDQGYLLFASNKSCREKGSRPTKDATQREAKLVVNSTVSNRRALREWRRVSEHGDGGRSHKGLQGRLLVVIVDGRALSARVI